MEKFLEDILTHFINEAFELKSSGNDEFTRGKLFGYYETISHLLNQAEGWGLSEKLPQHLRDFNAEELLSLS